MRFASVYREFKDINTFMDELKKMKKNSEITEDDLRDGEEQLQKITDDYVKQAETAAKKKEQEVLSI